MVEVIPAILEKDFSEIEKKIRMVEKYVKWVQIDLADNTLVPNATFIDPTPFSKITKVNLEAHLMVKDPLRYVEKFEKAGFKRFFAHIEGEFIEEYIGKCLQLGVEVGLAIDGPTHFTKIQKYLNDLDVILVMAIDAGFSGRPFRDDSVEKIKKIRELDFEIPITVDGAMNYDNAKKVVEAGATRINSNSYIFKEDDVRVPIEKLQSLSKSQIRL
jgi:ribulose-phosphate 3-epimerase